MTKLLILAYDFPPYVSVGGLRPYSWFKYLHLYDVYPVVVTRQWENRLGNTLDYISPGYSKVVEKQETSKGTIINAPFKPNPANKILLKYGENKFKLLRKFITSYYEFLQFVLPVGSKKEVYLAADDYLKHNEVDCIIATGDPFILFKYASKLSKEYSIPWIADYRDSWIQDTSMKSKVYEKWCAFFEKKLLKSAYKITTVSTFIQKQIEKNIKGKQFEILLNGYDPEIINLTKNIAQSNNNLSIALTGTVEDWHPVENFLNVCNKIIQENSGFKIELHFYAVNKESEIKELLTASYPLIKGFAYFHSKMNNLDFAKSVAKHNVCLLFNSYSILGTKIFDFLAVKRKIILCYENDKESEKLKKEFFTIDELETESKRLQADLITATNSGIVIKDSEHLEKVILNLAKELEENGFVSCESVNVDKYSRTNQVERLADIVKKAKLDKAI